MRVLTITNHFPPNYVGGAEIAALMTCQGLARRGVDTHVLVPNAWMPQPQDRYYEWEGLSVHQVYYHTRRRWPITDIFDRRIYRQTLEEIRRVRPDVIHIHNVAGASLAPFVAARRTCVPVVATLHDHWLLCPNNMLYRMGGEFCDPAQGTGYCSQCFRRYDFWGAVSWRRRILAAMVNHVHTFISPSQALIDTHVRGGYDRGRFQMIQYSIRAPSPARLEHQGVWQVLNAQERRNTLIYAGGGIETKGVETLIDALPMLTRYIERLQILVAGGGESHYLQLLNCYAPTVRVMGRVPYNEMPALYAASSLSLAISVWLENSPVVIQQSLLVGTPVLGSKVGGIPELIRDGETGYVVPHRDPLALAEAVIMHFSRSPYERRQMRRACLNYAVEHFDNDQHLDAVQQVYDQAISQA